MRISYKAGRFHQEVEAAKIRILRAALRRHRGNRTHTARHLGLQRSYLLRLIRKLKPEAAWGYSRSIACEKEPAR